MNVFVARYLDRLQSTTTTTRKKKKRKNKQQQTALNTISGSERLVMGIVKINNKYVFYVRKVNEYTYPSYDLTRNDTK